MAARRVRTHWTPAEDKWLLAVIEFLGPDKDWDLICQYIEGRTASSCKKRWSNHLAPQLVHDEFTPQEDRIIFWAHADIGKKWAKIARLLTGRTGNGVRNYWRCNMKRKYLSMTNKMLTEFMNKGALNFGLRYFVNPFNPTGSDIGDSSVPDLTLSLGLGYATAPKTPPIEPINLELSLALG